MSLLPRIFRPGRAFLIRRVRHEEPNGTGFITLTLSTLLIEHRLTLNRLLTFLSLQKVCVDPVIIAANHEDRYLDVHRRTAGRICDVISTWTWT